jgi:hypothetical protein
VIATAGRAPADSRELRACALWALAESAIVLPVVAFLLDELRPFGLGAGAMAVPFLVAYAGGATLAYRFRTSSNLGIGAAVVAVLAGLVVGRASFTAAAASVVVALLLALRIVSLALRDWRAPVHGELAWGTALLGAEALLAGLLPLPSPLLVALVPPFFAAGLSSRATTVWSIGDADELEERTGRPWIGRALVAAGGLALAMALAVLLGVRGGLFDLIGRIVRPAAQVVGAAVLWVIVQVARPLFWLADRLGIDPERLREFLERLRSSVAGARGPVETHPPASAPWARLLGVLVVVAIAFVMVRLLRRLRADVEVEPAEPATPRSAAVPRALEPPPGRVGARVRRELPADAVRRWYAEALIALRRKSLEKEPAVTPAEFVPEVAAAFPAGADDFRALTDAYEDVRYGNVRLDRERLRELEGRHRRLLETLRHARGWPVAPNG